MWTRSENGYFALLGCPTGFRLNNQSGHDVQGCIRCEEGKYMADPKNPSISCEKCPIGRPTLSICVALWQSCNP